MGLLKAILAKEEWQRDTAISIAIRAGVLRACEYHGEVYLPDAFVDVEPAYRLANARYTRGEFRDVFDTRTEMTDAIKAAVDEFAWGECPRCYKLLKD